MQSVRDKKDTHIERKKIIYLVVKKVLSLLKIPFVLLKHLINLVIRLFQFKYLFTLLLNN